MYLTAATSGSSHSFPHRSGGLRDCRPQRKRIKKTDDAVAPPNSPSEKKSKQSPEAPAELATASPIACSGTKENESDAAQDDALAVFSSLQGLIEDIGRGGEHNGKRTCRVAHFSPGDLFTHNCLINSKNIGDVAVEVIPAEPIGSEKCSVVFEEVSVVCDRRAAQTRLSFLTLAAPVLKLGCWVAYCGGGEDGGGRGQRDCCGAAAGAKRDAGGHLDPAGGHADAGEEGERNCDSTGPRHDLDVDRQLNSISAISQFEELSPAETIAARLCRVQAGSGEANIDTAGQERADEDSAGPVSGTADRWHWRRMPPFSSCPCAGERRRQGRLPPLVGDGLPLVGQGAGAGRAGGDVGAFIARANSCLTKIYSLN